MAEKNKNEKGNNLLIEVRSKYILGQILELLKESKKLSIIKYNKKLQNKIDINLEYFKKFSLNVIIEIIPLINKNGKFINYTRADNAQFIHIFFDNSKEEIHRNKIYSEDNVEKIKVELNYRFVEFNELFEGCDCIEKN